MELLEKLTSCDWKEFESLTKEIFELHNYDSFFNINLSVEGHRRQFDVIAMKSNKCLIIDCKKWNNKISKVSALKIVVEKHIERCNFFKKFSNKDIVPLIIIYNEEPILKYNNVFIVSLNKLNNFIQEWL